MGSIPNTYIERGWSYGSVAKCACWAIMLTLCRYQHPCNKRASYEQLQLEGIQHPLLCTGIYMQKYTYTHTHTHKHIHTCLNKIKKTKKVGVECTHVVPHTTGLVVANRFWERGRHDIQLFLPTGEPSRLWCCFKLKTIQMFLVNVVDTKHNQKLVNRGKEFVGGESW